MSEQATKQKWIKLDINEIMKCGDFYISYNPSPDMSPDDGAETALCRDGKFFILNGDYREKYEELSKLGFDECKKFFDQQNRKSSWSD